MRLYSITEAQAEFVVSHPQADWIDGERRKREATLTDAKGARKLRVVTALDDDTFVISIFVRRSKEVP